jgi:hypothetical protein
VLYAGDYTQEICVALDEWVGGEVENDVRRAMVVADLGLTCANIFAQKDASILRGAGLGVVFPYLDGAIASLGLATLDADFSVKPKEILRVALRRQAPAKLVERPKSGFVDPEKGVFFSEAFLEFLSAAMEDSAPIAGLLVKKNVVKARDCLVRGMALPQQTLNCLWAIVFTDRWYRTARGASRQ